MTRNQIEYLKVKMTGRELEETQRHNIASEALTARGMTETERHNLIVEQQSADSIQVARSQAAASMLGAQASMASAAAQAANAQAALMQARVAEQLEPYQEMVKLQEANTTRQQGDYYHSQDLGQRLQNQYYEQLTSSIIGQNEAKANQSNADAYWKQIQAELYPRTVDLIERGQDLSYQGTMNSSAIRATGQVASAGISAASKLMTDQGPGYSNTYVDMGNHNWDATSNQYFWP